MRAARFAKVSAGAIFGSWTSRERRRLAPPREARLARAVEGVVAEVLEERRLFAVTAVQNTTTNVLTITGDSNANTIRIYQQDYFPTDQISVEVVGQQGLLGPFNVDADLTLIRVNAGLGIDDVRFGNNAGYGLLAPSSGMAVSVPAEVHGDYDSDVLIGTDQADTIWGDHGNDQLYGAGGNDLLYGGYGDGAETGNDTLTGDGGADSLYGEDGNDLFHSSNDGATDYLDGGAGASDDAIDRDIGSDTTVNIEILS